MIVQKIFYQFLRFKNLLRFGLSMGIFLKLLVLTQVSMGVIITSVRPIEWAKQMDQRCQQSECRLLNIIFMP